MIDTLSHLTRDSIRILMKFTGGQILKFQMKQRGLHDMDAISYMLESLNIADSVSKGIQIVYQKLISRTCFLFEIADFFHF